MIRENYAIGAKRILWNHDSKKEYLTKSEIKAIEDTDLDDYPIVKQACLFSIYTGLRRADIIHLDWRNVILRSKFRPHLNITIRKTGINVTLPLSPSAIRVLGEKTKKSGLVFPGLFDELLNKQVPRLIKEAGICKHITFHCFRHTFAMQLLENGTDIYTIAKLMGHTSVSSTQVYAKLNQAQLRKAVLDL